MKVQDILDIISTSEIVQDLVVLVLVEELGMYSRKLETSSEEKAFNDHRKLILLLIPKYFLTPRQS